jgi:hypothetical protein
VNNALNQTESLKIEQREYVLKHFFWTKIKRDSFIQIDKIH